MLFTKLTITTAFYSNIVVQQQLFETTVDLSVLVSMIKPPFCHFKLDLSTLEDSSDAICPHCAISINCHLMKYHLINCWVTIDYMLSTEKYFS